MAAEARHRLDIAIDWGCYAELFDDNTIIGAATRPWKPAEPPAGPGSKCALVPSHQPGSVI